MRHSLRFVWQDIKNYLSPRIYSIVNMGDGVDYEGTITAIKTGAGLKGAEFWLLVCSTVIVAIGMDLNSPAVIIAGILITPILKPIIGVGLGFGISDKDMIFSSLKNFAFIAFVIFTTAVFYFIITPLGQPTAELNARAKPILLDVLVAIFGGIAIIINYSRQQRSIAFPRVIIGYALIPPLCTSGYGFIHADARFYFGSIYLFLLNSFFISLAIYTVVRYLNFPFHRILDTAMRKKMQKSIALLAVFLILPSSYILYDVVIQAKHDRKAQTFVNKYISGSNFEAIRWDFDDQDSVKFLKVFVAGELIPEEKVSQYRKDFRKYFLDDYHLKIIQMQVPEASKSQIKQELANEVALSVINQLQKAQEEKQIKQGKIDSLQRVMRELYLDKEYLQDLKAEVEIAFPEVNNVRFGLLGADILDTASGNLMPVAHVFFDKKVNRRVKTVISDRISNFLSVKFKRDSIKVIFE
ncbi:DUF389 domain-containing protein [Candidatus Kapaibacterium sp.]